MGRLAAAALALGLLLAGCLQIYETPGAPPNTTNSTALPQRLSLCLYGLTNSADLQLGSNLTCQGRSIELGVHHLNNASPLIEFAGCAVFFLRDDGEGRYLERAQRAALRQAILEGRSLVLWGEAGTLMRSDPSVLGWEPELGELVPARITSPGREPQRLGHSLASGTLSLARSDRLLEGYQALEVKNANVTEVAVESPANVAAYLNTGAEATSPAHYAILRLAPQSLESALAQNHVYYFSFDPQRHSPTQLRQLLRALAQNWLSYQQIVC